MRGRGEVADDEKSYLIGISSEVDYIKQISNANYSKLVNSQLQVNDLETSLHQATDGLSNSEFHQSIIESFDLRKKKHCTVYILIVLQFSLLIILLMYGLG